MAKFQKELNIFFHMDYGDNMSPLIDASSLQESFLQVESLRDVYSELDSQHAYSFGSKSI